jgi:hypothetical protein
MATQTRFDLNAALESWRNELASQPQLTLDDRRELERHLADVMAELRQHGLNDEESFWLACRRIGQPEKIAAEFRKVDEVSVWRERIFWGWLVVFFWRVFDGIIGSVAASVFNAIARTGPTSRGFNWTTEESLLFLLPIFLPLLLVVLLARGKLILHLSRLMPLIENRLRLGFVTFAFILLSVGIRSVALAISSHRTVTNLPAQGMANLLISTVYAIVMGAVLIWLLPSQSQKHQLEKLT